MDISIYIGPGDQETRRAGRAGLRRGIAGKLDEKKLLAQAARSSEKEREALCFPLRFKCSIYPTQPPGDRRRRQVEEVGDFSAGVSRREEIDREEIETTRAGV